MANAKTVNWSTLDRSSLYAYFNSLGGDIVGKRLTPDQIHRALSKHIKSVLPIKVKKYIDAKIEQGYVYTGGMYYSELDRKDKTAIEVNFSYHPLDETLKFTEHRWRRLSVRITDVVLHEIIHMRQFRARGFKSIPGYHSTAELTKQRKEQEYYGDTDEMGAFAFNIACELVERFGYEPTVIKRYLDSNNARRHRNSWWCSYLKCFNWNHDHRIIRRMKLKIMHQLENAHIGKPFKTNEWLTY